MKIRDREGDIFAGPERVLVHDCNAFGKMGAGLARQVKRRYPEAFCAYRPAFESSNDPEAGLPLGSATWVRAADGRLIVNAVTQRDDGRAKGRVSVDDEAERTVLRAIDARARRDGFEGGRFPAHRRRARGRDRGRSFRRSSRRRHGPSSPWSTCSTG